MKPFTKQDFGWVAVMTRPGAEEAAYEEVKRKLALWSWFPSVRVRRRRKSPGRTVVQVFDDELPLFSRYIFVRLIDDGDISAVQDLINVSAIVKQPGAERPMRIPGAVMDELMSEYDNRGRIDTTKRQEFEEGQRVVFNDDNPFAGLIAFIAKDDGGKKVRLWLESLGKETKPLVVNVEHIRAA